MSGQSRYERLEIEIVEGLRRAPGAEPSSELDARILARAHAAVAKAPMRRSQPRWMSLAAGVVVLVGSGLALRIWQQLEHAPSQLDAPPAASAPMPQSSALESTEMLNRADAEESVAADTVSASSEAAAGSDQIGTKRELAAPRNTPATSIPADRGSSAPAPPPMVDDRQRKLAQPFPAETRATGTAAAAPAAPAPAAPKRAPMPAAAAAPVAKPRMEVAEPVLHPAPIAAPPPPPETAASSRSKSYPVGSTPEPERSAKISLQRAAKEELAVPEANMDGTIDVTGTRMPAALSGGSAAAGMAAGNLSEAAKSAPNLADTAAEPFDVAVEDIRQALQQGKLTEARRLLQILRDNYPNRRLPKDLEFADDANH